MGSAELKFFVALLVLGKKGATKPLPGLRWVSVSTLAASSSMVL